jgi:hypothetical protein
MMTMIVMVMVVLMVVEVVMMICVKHLCAKPCAAARHGLTYLCQLFLPCACCQQLHVHVGAAGISV